MAHNFFTPGIRSLAVIEEMVSDKHPKQLIHEGENLKQDVEHKISKVTQQSQYCLANYFRALGALTSSKIELKI